MNKHENKAEKEQRPQEIEQSKPLNKEQVKKALLTNGEDDFKDIGYNPEADPVPVVVFDSELRFIKDSMIVDIVFLIDATASMRPYMKGTKRLIRKIIWDAQKCLTQYLVDEVEILLAGIVSYKDHDQESKTYVSKVNCNLTSDFVAFKDALMKIEAKGGADEPEAVLDGLNDVIENIQWRKHSNRFLYHILDAPPHGKTFNNCKNDDYAECPCGLDYSDILKAFAKKKMKYTIIKLSDEVDQMIEVFSSLIDIEVLSPDIKADQSQSISQYQ